MSLKTPKKIGIIGLGLIGGSLLKALQGKEYELFAVTRNQNSINSILENNLAKEASSDISILKNMDVIFVATPIDYTIKTIEEAFKIAPDALFCDLASVKGFILDFANTNPQLNFIGLHPMAGTEHQGFEHSSKNMFDGSNWAVIPSNFTKKSSIDWICTFIKNINANPIFCTAKEHDLAVSEISHFPMILAQVLFSQTENPLSKKLASSGFRDMTRLAMSNEKMAQDMLKYNKTAIKETFEKFNKNLSFFIDFYEKMPLFEIKQNRQQMYSKDGKNIL